MKKSFNHDLSTSNTFRMNVSCACYIEYDSVEELADFFSSGRQFDLPRPFLHIGGGSNEFVISDGKNILWKRSFPLGMARMREKFDYAEPIPADVVSAFGRFCNSELQPLWAEIEKYSPKLFVGSSGSFDTFRDLLYFNQDGDKPYKILERDKMKGLHERLLASNSQQRLSMPGMSPIRVDYIVLASVFTQLVLDRTAPDVICQSSYSLKEGAMAVCYDSWLKNGKIV